MHNLLCSVLIALTHATRALMEVIVQSKYKVVQCADNPNSRMSAMGQWPAFHSHEFWFGYWWTDPAQTFHCYWLTDPAQFFHWNSKLKTIKQGFLRSTSNLFTTSISYICLYHSSNWSSIHTITACFVDIGLYFHAVKCTGRRPANLFLSLFIHWIQSILLSLMAILYFYHHQIWPMIFSISAAAALR